MCIRDSCNGHFEENQYIIEYLGVKFWIDFDQEKFNNDTEKIEPAFQIKYIGIA